MGKKSKKGVVRTNTKKHNAAGHGKSNSKALGSGHHGGGNSQISSCDNSLDSNSVKFNNNNQMKSNIANTTNTVAVTPMPMVHVKDQLPPSTATAQSQQQQRRLTEEDIRNLIINNIIQQRNNMNDKENKSGLPPSMTVISSKTPAVFSLNLDDGNIDDVTQVEIPLAEEQQSKLPPVETAASATSTKNDLTQVEGATTLVTENVTEGIVPTPTTESSMLPESIVNIDPELTQVATKPPSVTPSTTVATETLPAEVEVVPAKEEPVFAPVELVPSKEMNTMSVVEVESTEPVPPTENNKAKQSIDSQQQQIWSSTLRSIVSTDEDEVLSDTPIKNKAVMDVTPLKHSKLVVPIIQTVSPSPEHSSKNSNNISYLNSEEPIPSLDTPAKKDLDQDVKQNLCGCTVM